VELNRCHNPNQRAVFIDAIIWDRIIESMSQPEKVMEMIEEINNRPERAGVTTELKETDKRLDNLDKEQARLLEEALRGFPDKLVESENKKINDSRARLEERKDELLQGIEQAKQDKIEIDDINKACKVMECMLLHRLGIKDMRKTLELLNIKVYLDGEKLYLTGNLLLPENKPVSEKDLCRLGLISQY
jgi:hypothetical protein